MTALVAAVGIILLVGVVVITGVYMDTEAQRVEWREVARERRLRNEELRALRAERLRLHQERLLLAAEHRAFHDRTREYCAQCPLRGQAERVGDGY